MNILGEVIRKNHRENPSHLPSRNILLDKLPRVRNLLLRRWNLLLIELNDERAIASAIGGLPERSSKCGWRVWNLLRYIYRNQERASCCALPHSPSAPFTVDVAGVSRCARPDVHVVVARSRSHPPPRGAAYRVVMRCICTADGDEGRGGGRRPREERKGRGLCERGGRA